MVLCAVLKHLDLSGLEVLQMRAILEADAVESGWTDLEWVLCNGKDKLFGVTDACSRR